MGSREPLDPGIVEGEWGQVGGGAGQAAGQETRGCESQD